MSNMSDENRELVSALIDGEASEIEIHKLLQQYKLDEGHEGTGHTIRDTLLSFGRVTDAIGASRGGTKSVALDPEKHRVLHQAISEAIAEDDTVFDAPLARRANAPLIRSRAFQASALAACLVVAVGLGITVMQTGMNSGGLFSDSPGDRRWHRLVCHQVMDRSSTPSRWWRQHQSNQRWVKPRIVRVCVNWMRNGSGNCGPI